MLSKLTTLQSYKSLIKALPIMEQGFVTKRTTWEKQTYSDLQKSFNSKLFGNEISAFISRQDLINAWQLETKHDFILKVIYWGYPRGMRGNNFKSCYAQIEEITIILTNIEQGKYATFTEIRAAFKPIKGLGLSTYSKLLYFMQVQIEDKQALILDDRLINVCRINLFEELTELAKIRKETGYIKYLTVIEREAKKLNVPMENLSYFLFLFGDKLKPIK